MVQVSKQPESPATAGRTCRKGLASLLAPRLFKALSDPKRLSLLARLAEEKGPCTVGHVAEGSGVDLSVVSRHLAILREAGIIRCVKRGKEVFCIVEKTAVVRMLRELADALETCCPDKTLEDLPGGNPQTEPPGKKRSLRRTRP
ncbi:MAG: metalloregulator ArsR/SmtB family transcription factor [bacterium]|jgi:ArsR family transcriptional regulator